LPSESPAKASGVSPLEKEAMTLPSRTGEPQSSFSWTIKVAGHPAGTAKLFGKPVSVMASLKGIQPLTSGLGREISFAPGGSSTTTVTFTDSSACEMEMFTLPV
jgi:hypothetical protein